MPNKTVVGQDAVTRYVTDQIAAGRAVDEIRISEVHKTLGGRYERVREFLENARVAFGAPRTAAPIVEDEAAHEITSASKSYLAKLQEMVKREDAERIEALECQIESLTAERDAASKSIDCMKQELEALQAELEAERAARQDQDAITKTTGSLSQSVASMAEEITAVVTQIEEVKLAQLTGQKEVLATITALSDSVQHITITNDAASDAEAVAEAPPNADEAPPQKRRKAG